MFINLTEKEAEKYLDEEEIFEKLKYQALHIIATNMDTMDKHMAEAYIISYADSIDADVENIICYPRNAVNPIIKNICMKVKIIVNKNIQNERRRFFRIWMKLK